MFDHELQKKPFKQQMLGCSKVSQTEEKTELKENILIAQQLLSVKITDPLYAGVRKESVQFCPIHIFLCNNT